MGKQTLVAVVIGLGIVAIVVGSILLSTRKNRVELTGEVLKVRSQQIDPEHTLALIDMRVTNPSTQQFVVRELEVFIDEPDGKSTAAELFSETDIKRVIAYYPAIGEKYNPGLLRRDKINSQQTTDRTVGISAPMPDERLQHRKAIRIMIHDVDGPTTTITERK